VGEPETGEQPADTAEHRVDQARVGGRLVDDPERARRMGEYNRARFLERMAWEYSAAELLRAYDRLCPPTRAR